ncbi:autotransporter outer membrane beta-barrel domain-containing protein [Achromobacter seleniivolatilans]|uniref:Autotransporter outer membrane beta-barrel domain-containing protein n=1 Tax=Achromobacter seleniivolatilans TaxID=3047478 RepID=A0ABY9M514_9BURK|nr:autotransporter outer membrane beta-barrel domain-containing protein [Achromobacter sp. R39]WMD22089.1 autotransporter outer membrane beta-barrel domain-containing protein [Achromobacter sp. R39]
MASLLVAIAPVYSAATQAAELGQIDVSDPLGNTQLILESGSTITHPGAGPGIGVTGASNSVTGNNITVQVSGQRSAGVMAVAGGVVNLSDSRIETLGAGQNAHGLYATGAGSRISVTGAHITTAGEWAHGAYADAGGKISLHGGSIATTEVMSAGLYAEGRGAVVTAESLTINTEQFSGHSAVAAGGGRIEMVGVTAKNPKGTAVWAFGDDSTVKLTDTHLISRQGIAMASSALTMQGGSVTANEAVYLGLDGNSRGAPSAVISNATLTSTGTYGININASGASATVDNVSILSQGYSAVWMPGNDSVFSASNFSIDALQLGIDNRAGLATLRDGSVLTRNSRGYGLYVWSDTSRTALINATKVKVKTHGANAIGVVALGRTSGARISLTESTVDTYGQSASGLHSAGVNARTSAINTIVRTHGNNAAGVAMQDNTIVVLDNTQVYTNGADAHAIWSSARVDGVTNTLRVTNGSVLNSANGIGLLANGGNHNIVLENSRVIARMAGAEHSGIFLRTVAASIDKDGETTIIETGQVNVDATGSALTGDVLADSGAVDIRLNNASILTGAMIGRAGRINSVSLDSSSVWNVRGNSNIGTLNNAGTVSFVAPNAQAGFKTLTVNEYVGGGTLVLNTALGDDASLTDKLVIDGGTTSGVTAMRVLNAGGTGGETIQGIRVVETMNGGATTADAFRLDTGSTGYRGSSGTVSINGYDYSLVRGGNHGVESDWYLTSIYTPPPGGQNPSDPPITEPEEPQEPVNPGQPGGPGTDPGPITPPDVEVPPGGRPVYTNVSPESGAFLGNQMAATAMFAHSASDRAMARMPSNGNASDASLAGRSFASNSLAARAFAGAGYASGDDGPATSPIWVRMQGSHAGNLRMAQGNVTIDSDSSMLQLGGDMLRIRLGSNGALLAGMMVGYGDARVHSTSRIFTSGASQAVHAKTRGKVTGYSLGMYATAYANAATGLGAYADSSLQYGRYANRLNSELGSARYHSNVWSASVEGGYAFAPFASGSALGAVVVEPQAQLTYNRYDAGNSTLQGTTLKSSGDNTINTRAGVRVYPLGKPGAASTVTPFLEANWLHNTGTPRVNMGAGNLSAVPMRNAAELKLGAQGRIGKSVMVSGQVSGQAGSDNQRGYGGMLTLAYRW